MAQDVEPGSRGRRFLALILAEPADAPCAAAGSIGRLGWVQARLRSVRAVDSTPDYPKPEFRDRFRQVISAASDLTPATAVAMNVVDLLIAPSLQKRRDEFFAQIAMDLARLAVQMSDLEAVLAEREDKFATLALNASLAAVRTNDQVKLQRLRNAALNGTIRDVDESTGEMFLQAVSEMTPLHVEVLTYLSDPFAALTARGIDATTFERGPRLAAFHAVFPELGTHPHQMVGVILRDLYARGFVLTDDFGNDGSSTVVLGPWTTDLGITFLAFLDPPWDG